jgi:hypothetical protein
MPFCFWIALVFEFLHGIPKTFLCSMSALLVKTVLMLDALQLLIVVCRDIDVFGTKTLYPLNILYNLYP